MPRTFRFNETLCVDLFEIESADGSKNVSHLGQDCYDGGEVHC